MTGTLLIEILTEELPTAAVRQLSDAGAELLAAALEKEQLAFGAIRKFSTPRRLAWLVSALAERQPEQLIERKGPAIGAAKDAAGHWTKAALGFAKSCGVEIDALDQRDGYLHFSQQRPGQELKELFPSIFKQLTDNLPIAKRMRWADHEHSFVRPVLSLIALFKGEVLPLEYFGLRAGNQTRGHRVHGPGPITIKRGEDYEGQLEQACVIADYDRRKQLIREQIEALGAAQGAQTHIEEDLLEEVAALVEYPVALVGNFEEEFLAIPQEVLITTMRDNQKTFPLMDRDGKLLAHFIAIANLKSREPDLVRRGNEKVIRPRFADAQFFWQQDLKHKLADRLPRLASVAYQAKLGTLADKVARLGQLSTYLCTYTGANREQVATAAQLCKSDLLTEMVMEFPELQGLMGYYYAKEEGLPAPVASALYEQYFPLGARGSLPSTREGLTLALAEKTDVLVGGFAVGARPSGSKDPYGLRRNAIGLIRLIIEKELILNLRNLLEQSAHLFPSELNAAKYIPEIEEYIIERLEHYYREENISVEVYQAVKALQLNELLDFHHRVKALDRFLRGGQVEILLSSAKRIRNILKKNGTVDEPVDTALLLAPEEQALFQALRELEQPLAQALARSDYYGALELLGSLERNLDSFFTNVMVMAEDKKLQRNRLALLTLLQNKFNLIADLSLI